ncbi:MAG: hypothetical protein AVDCRST_MAG47-308 [uncultured Nocardioidaceae bacterium]|uniref:Phage shock protein PspC N-terminal domain-containing protein n=1 Tax=uncultured Nocardioidaceae bacterium TaxID=253824 RepID=A0A6J4MLF9_9ACTN|nr:MAG: hypothetical protein AVDCRST_MAG47-308 [uncultured Nocardioidaceae bacterium]
MTENVTGTPRPDPATEPQPGPQGPPPGWDTENLKDYRKLRRTRLDRKVAGVAGGLGSHLNIDPTILRVLFVVLAFFGGSGILLYGALWLLVPEEGSEHVVISTSESTRNGLLIGAAAVAGLIALGDTWTGFGFPWPVAIVGLVVAAVLISRDSNKSRAVPPYTGGQAYTGAPPYAGTVPPYAGTTPPPPPSSADAAPYTSAPYTSAGTEQTATLPTYGGPGSGTPWYPPTPPPPVPPRPRRKGPLLFGITLALIALALGTLGLLDASGADVEDAAYPALALTVVGAMLVLGAFWGRPGGLIALGLVSSLLLAAFSIGNPTFEGDRDVRFTPTRAVDVAAVYDVPAGRIELDLTEVEDLEELDGQSIRLEANAGELVVIVPDDLAVDLNADIEYGGAIETPSGMLDGWSRSLQTRLDEGDAAAEVELELDLQFGHIEVRQQ